MKRKPISTPVGTAVWPKLNEPDTRWKPEGEYTVSLRLDAADADALIKEMTTFYDEAYAWFCMYEKKKKLNKASSMPWSFVEDDKGEKTGEVDFKFKLKARVETRRGDSFTQKVVIFDSEGKPMSEHVGGGSTIRVRGEMNPWFTSSLGFGISLWVKAVQVKTLVEAAGGGTAKSFGFDSIEGGFTTSEDFEFADTKAPLNPDADADDF